MADPLSLTLAAITLATAIKDMVELAQLIDESFEKVTRNARELRSLTSEIRTTVFQLKEFSDSHYDILCNAPDTKIAVLALTTDMKIIYEKCREMFPPVPLKKIGKFKAAFSAYMNRNRMEEDIKDLRNRVNKCHSQFMMFAVMRIESHLIVMKRQNNEEPKKARKEIASSSASGDRLIAFVGSNARTLSKLPPEITADFISDTYLCLQIDTIDAMLNQLSSNSYPVEEPLEEYLLPYRPVVPRGASWDKNSIRQEIILQSLEIQSYLRTDSANLSIQAGAWEMVNLCIGLHTLKMYDEALTTGKWTVNLFRTLARTNPKIYLPYVVHSLRMLSRFHVKVDDLDGAFSAIEEAIQISRDLQSSSTNIEIEFQLGGALTTLAYTWGLKDNGDESLKAAQEGVDIYDKALEENRKRTSQGPIAGFFPSPMASLFHDIPHKAISDYGRALDQLSYSFQAVGRLEEAFNTAKKSLDVMLYSTNSFLDDYLEIEIAFMFYRLSHQDFHDFISLEDALAYSKEGVVLFRHHAARDMQENGMSLCNALWEQANILGKLERWDEALVLWRETAELANDIMTDQFFRAEALSQLSWSLRKLKRHDEAASIRTESVTVYSRNKGKADKEAHGYFDLGVELRLAGKRPEAIKALQAALTQYRALAFKEPEVYTKNIGRTLNQLTMNYVHVNEFDHAFNEGHESLKLHGSLLETDPSVLAEYILALRVNCLAAEVADNEDKCIERARYNIECARNVARLHPAEGNIVFSQMVHTLSLALCRFNRVAEAGTVIEEALDWHDKYPSEDGKEVEQHMHCLITKTAIIFNQGHIQKAGEYVQKSIDIGKPHASHKSVASTLVSSMHRRVQIFYLTGRFAEAVDAGKECVDFARQLEMEAIADFVGCLQVAAIAFRFHGKFNEALAYIQEAIDLSRGNEVLEASKMRPSVLLLESESLAYFCEILADAGQEPQALIEAKTAVDIAMSLKSKYATLPWSEIEPTYIDTLETYSLRLAASGDVLGCLEGLVQVRAYYEGRIDSRIGDSLNLARILYVEGVLSCAGGRPDDAAAAIAKLEDMRKRLRIAHPELAENVEIGLKTQRNVRSWVALLATLDLKCGHEH